MAWSDLSGVPPSRGVPFPSATASLDTPQGRSALLALPAQLPNLKIIGVGVTEAGLVPNSQVGVGAGLLMYPYHRSGRVPASQRGGRERGMEGGCQCGRYCDVWLCCGSRWWTWPPS